MKKIFLFSLLNLFVLSLNLNAAEGTDKYKAMINIITNQNPSWLEYFRKFIERFGDQIDWNKEIPDPASDDPENPELDPLPFIIISQNPEAFLEILKNPITRNKINLNSQISQTRLISFVAVHLNPYINPREEALREAFELLLNRGVVVNKPYDAGLHTGKTDLDIWRESFPSVYRFYQNWLAKKRESKERKESEEKKGAAEQQI